MATIEKLGLKGGYKRSFGVKAVCAKFSYNKIEAMPEALEALGSYQITPEVIQSARQEVLEAETADTNKQKAKADAPQNCTNQNTSGRKWHYSYYN